MKNFKSPCVFLILFFFSLLLSRAQAQTPTVSSLQATGTGIKWYSAASGGTLYNGTEALVNGQTYYASQTVNGCESTTRFAVTATLITVDAPAAGTHTPSQTEIIWNWDAVSGATGYRWGTTDVYADATDMLTATTKTESSLTCNTEYTRYIWAYNASGCVSGSTMLTQSTTSCGFSCGSTITISHVTGVVAPVDKTVTYGTVTGISGEPAKCWITSNLGADHQAIAVDDATEPSAGWYWRFNRKQGYKNDGSTTPSWTITIISESSDWITANDPCNIELGATWRNPTYTEWYNVNNTGGWTTRTGPWDSGLKLHAAGYLAINNGSLNFRGFYGYYWSSSQYDALASWHLYFDSSYSNVDTDNKASGYSVRCVRD